MTCNVCLITVSKWHSATSAIPFISSLETPGGDSEEGGSVIKLDIPSGEGETDLAANPGAGIVFHIDVEKMKISKARLPSITQNMMGTGDAYYTAMNAMGAGNQHSIMQAGYH